MALVTSRMDLRKVAIIAHADYRKTSPVHAMLCWPGIRRGEIRSSDPAIRSIQVLIRLRVRGRLRTTPRVRAIDEKISQVAATDATVLIRGELSLMLARLDPSFAYPVMYLVP